MLLKQTNILHIPHNNHQEYTSDSSFIYCLFWTMKIAHLLTPENKNMPDFLYSLWFNNQFLINLTFDADILRFFMIE